MQSVIVIPERSVLQRYPDAEGVLTREIAGVPLLIRVIATAARAGVEKFLVMWPADVDQSIWHRCAASPLLKGLEIRFLVQDFKLGQPASWAAVEPVLEEQFLWLPWNWLTHKRALTGFATWPLQAPAWDVPELVEKVMPSRTRRQAAEGVLITPVTNTAEAERFLVAHAGKPSDGIYSKFNRMLCRPAVRLLTHTPVTPNLVTLGGLLVGILAAFMYARGFYAAYVAGAVLFFLSGLFDDADGMLARIKFRESVFGTWFEGLVDEASYLLLFSGITAGLSGAWSTGADSRVSAAHRVRFVDCGHSVATQAGHRSRQTARVRRAAEPFCLNRIRISSPASYGRFTSS